MPNEMAATGLREGKLMNEKVEIYIVPGNPMDLFLQLVTGETFKMRCTCQLNKVPEKAVLAARYAQPEMYPALEKEIRQNGKIALLKRARKDHQCKECRRRIVRGNRYYQVFIAGGGYTNRAHPVRVHPYCLFVNHKEVQDG